jgi:hypothetical protein
MIRILAAALCLSLTAPALAAGNAQQQRMKDCNQKATGLKGDERKAFMSKCLKGESAAPDAKATATEPKADAKATDAKATETKADVKPASDQKPMTQNEKMKACNKQAEGKKGDERKKFMSDCLKAK